MTFFALTTTARSQGDHPALSAHRPSESVFLTSNLERARPRSRQALVLPSLTVVRRYFSENKRLFLVSVSEHPGDRYIYSLQLSRGWQSGSGAEWR